MSLPRFSTSIGSAKTLKEISCGPVTAKTCASSNGSSTASKAAPSDAKPPSAGCRVTKTWNGRVWKCLRKNLRLCRNLTARNGTAKSSATKSYSSSSTTTFQKKWSTNANSSSAACSKKVHPKRSEGAAFSLHAGTKPDIRISLLHAGGIRQHRQKFLHPLRREEQVPVFGAGTCSERGLASVDYLTWRLTSGPNLHHPVFPVGP